MALRGLTSLRLHDLGASFQPTITLLKVTLSRMQDLTHLHLENALPSVRANSVDQFLEYSEKLIFPKLTRLSILVPFTTVVLLLSCFDIPLKTEVRLRCCFEADAEDHAPIYPLLAKRFIASKYQTLDPTPIIRTCFIETASATVGFIFSTTEGDFGLRAFSASTTSYDLGQLNEDWDCHIPLKVNVVLRTSLSRDRERLAENICRSVPLSNLQSARLSFDGGTSLSPAFWIKTFGHLQKFRHIRLSRVNLQGLVQGLSPSLHRLPMDKSGDLVVETFAPALKELEFYSTPFSRACDSRSQGNPSNCTCSVQYLRDALSDRQAEGYGLRRLVLAECVYVRDYDVESLRDSVTEIYWDGTTRMTATSESEDEDGAEDGDDRPHGFVGMPRFLA